jgi:hypothetical protein
MAAHPGNPFFATAQAELHRRFGIGHVTLQVELDEDPGCGDCGHAAPTAS